MRTLSLIPFVAARTLNRRSSSLIRARSQSRSRPAEHRFASRHLDQHRLQFIEDPHQAGVCHPVPRSVDRAGPPPPVRRRPAARSRGRRAPRRSAVPPGAARSARSGHRARCRARAGGWHRRSSASAEAPIVAGRNGRRLRHTPRHDHADDGRGRERTSRNPQAPSPGGGPWRLGDRVLHARPHDPLEAVRRFGHRGIHHRHGLRHLVPRLPAVGTAGDVRVDAAPVRRHRPLRRSAESTRRPLGATSVPHSPCMPTRESGRSATRIFFTARKIECFAAFVRRSSARRISSIEHPW